MSPKEETKVEVMEVDEEKKPTDVDAITIEKIRDQCRLIERGEAAKEGHYMVRVLRTLVSTRKALNGQVLGRLLPSLFAHSSHAALRSYFAAILPADSAPDKATVEADKKALAKSPRPMPSAGKKAGGGVVPEVELYIHLLFVVFLLDKDEVKRAEECVEALLVRLEEVKACRSLEALTARVIYYQALLKVPLSLLPLVNLPLEEKLGQLAGLRPWLHKRLTLATLRHEEESQAVLINCLIRSFLLQSLYQPALKLVAKVTFPENANSNEWARHFYYLGVMKAMECDYSGAQKCLNQALGKAPKDTAIGFKQRVQKMWVVVELLLAAEFPSRTLFRHPHFRRCLAPYLRLTSAVRVGDVHEFNAVVSSNMERFHSDGTLPLILRLRQNVIKTAIRQISLAYSRISVTEVQKKLELETADDAEYILCKALKESVMEGSVNHEEGWLASGESKDVYSTSAPAQLFHSRVAFCLKLHNQAVKAMRFPAKSYQAELESAEEQREREAQVFPPSPLPIPNPNLKELEFAKELAEDDDFE